jgi:hypothetical protein
MKQSLFFVAFTFFCATTAFTQSIVGKWSGEFPAQNDQPAMKFTLTITESTYQFDMGMDGTVDITGSYTSDGKQITIWDTAGTNACPSDQKGVYAYTFSGDTATFTKVSDACAARGGEPLTVKKM